VTDGRANGSFTGAGGHRIFTQSWLLAGDSGGGGGAARGLVVIVHGFGEHSDRYEWVARRLADAGFAVFAGDHRGHGRSEGERALVDVDDAVADIDRLVDLACAQLPGLPVFMLGHSLGGMLALRYALAHQVRLRGLVLSGPLAAVDAPPALARVGRLVARVAPRLGLIKLDPDLVSRDPEVVAAYRADPLVHHGRVPARTAAQMAETVASFPESVGAITLPTLIVYGTADGLCPPRGSVMLGERIGSDDLTVRAYGGLFHEVLNEPERETVIGDVLGWLEAHLSAGPPPPSPPPAPAPAPAPPRPRRPK
jgi:alpha-beta hydrolase superfamily lysophospholipase